MSKLTSAASTSFTSQLLPCLLQRTTLAFTWSCKSHIYKVKLHCYYISLIECDNMGACIVDDLFKTVLR